MAVWMAWMRLDAWGVADLGALKAVGSAALGVLGGLAGGLVGRRGQGVLSGGSELLDEMSRVAHIADGGASVGAGWLGAGASMANWMLGVGAVVLWVVSGRMLARARRAFRGVRTERRVLSELVTIPDATIWCGLRPGEWGGDLDFCVEVGRVVVVVEAKTGRGRVTYGDGRMRAGGRLLPGDPVAQVRKEASRAAQHFQKTAFGVVCVADGTSGLMVGEVPVVGLSKLKETVLALR